MVFFRASQLVVSAVLSVLALSSRFDGLDVAMKGELAVYSFSTRSVESF